MMQSLREWGLADTPAGGRRRLRRFLAGVVVAVGAVSSAAWAPAQARPSTPSEGAATVELRELPVQAQQTYRLVLAGGPFPYDKDGTVFGNRERLLPAQPRGYYREYTVRTPGERHRGARRLVCGGVPPVQPEVCYYTADHYASFARVVP